VDRAALESPLVPRVLDRPGGVLRGKSEPGQFFTEGGRRRPYEFVRWHRSGSYLWDGHTLSWENLRAKPPDESSPVPASTGPPAARTLPEHSRLPSTS